MNIEKKKTPIKKGAGLHKGPSVVFHRIKHLSHAYLDELGDEYIAMMWIKKGENPWGKDSLFKDISEIKVFLGEEYCMSQFEPGFFPNPESERLSMEDKDYIDNEIIDDKIINNLIKRFRNEQHPD